MADEIEKQFEKLPVKAPACEVLHKYRGVLLRLDVWKKLCAR